MSRRHPLRGALHVTFPESGSGFADCLCRFEDDLQKTEKRKGLGVLRNPGRGMRNRERATLHNFTTVVLAVFLRSTAGLMLRVGVASPKTGRLQVAMHRGAQPQGQEQQGKAFAKHVHGGEGNPPWRFVNRLRLWRRQDYFFGASSKTATVIDSRQPLRVGSGSGA